MIEELIKEPEFRFFAAVLYEAYHSPTFQKDYADLHLYDVREREKDAVEALLQNDEDRLFDAATKLLTVLAASTTLYPRIEDYIEDKDGIVDQRIKWSLQSFNDPAKMRVIVPAILAVAASTPVYVSIKEAAEASGMSESAWHTRCQNGEIPGAAPVDNTWIIPEHHLILKGYRR